MTEFQVGLIDESESEGRYPCAITILVEPLDESVRNGTNLIMDITFYRDRVTKQDIRDAAEKIAQVAERRDVLVEE